MLPRGEPWTSRLAIDSTTGGDGMHLEKSQIKIFENISAPAPRQARRATPTQQSPLQPGGKKHIFTLIVMSSPLGSKYMKDDLQCLPIRAGEESVHVASRSKNYVTAIPNCLKGGNHPRPEVQIENLIWMGFTDSVPKSRNLNGDSA